MRRSALNALAPYRPALPTQCPEIAFGAPRIIDSVSAKLPELWEEEEFQALLDAQIGGPSPCGHPRDDMVILALKFKEHANGDPILANAKISDIRRKINFALRRRGQAPSQRLLAAEQARQAAIAQQSNG